MKKKDYKYDIEYTEGFIKNIETHKKIGQKGILTKINKLINELREHPYIGTGSPEPLIGDRKGQWSRRINHRHRLIYEINEETITVLLVSGMGHYEDK